jgi:cytochrome c oxidase accessory protein FixG
LSFLVANIFLAYVISSDKLLLMAQEGPVSHAGTFTALLIFTVVFYFVFVWFREQVCIIACPYGRLQGVLTDNKTIQVLYDFVRGEKLTGRAKINKNENRVNSGKGDCIDCNLCVHVCPMGIDIRNGTQLECTNCTACIDECDTVMQKVGFEKGLIRYASTDEVEKNQRFKFTLRMKGYAAVLVVLIGVLFSLMLLRNDVEISVLRLPGQLFQREGETISNVFTYKVVNKTTRDFEQLDLKILTHSGVISTVGKPVITLGSEGIISGTLFIKIPESDLHSEKTKLEIGVFSKGELIEKTTTSFLSPRAFN